MCTFDGHIPMIHAMVGHLLAVNNLHE